MSRFNLIDEPWIPVRRKDGSFAELGIKEVLLSAKEFVGIEDPSPLVVASLYRFLLAVLYRAQEGPTDIDQAKVLFREGLPADRIDAYLEKWKNRFWLFDERYPFGQHPYIKADEIEPWTKLTPEFNARSNKVLFDHTDTRNPGVISPRNAARWLLTTTHFSISGGRGYYPSPSPNAMMCIPIGRNLSETFLFNLVPYANREVQKGDQAQWEKEPLALPLATPKRAARGYADIFTWQSRFVQLEADGDGNVSRLRFIAGEGFENPTREPDPMQPSKPDKEHGWLPVQFRGDRATWRDFDALLPGPEGLEPKTIQHSLALVIRNGTVPKSILVLGLRYEPPNANLDFWRQDQFVLPTMIAENKSVRADIKRLLEVAESAQTALWSASRSFARDVVGHGERVPDKNDIKAFVSQLPGTPAYWSILEIRFQEILHACTLDADPDAIEHQWLRFVRDALKSAWQLQKRSVSGGDAWSLRALVKAEVPVLKKLAELNLKIAEYQTNQPEENG